MNPFKCTLLRAGLSAAAGVFVTCSAGAQDEVLRYQKGGWDTLLEGCFAKECTVQPNGNILYYERRSGGTLVRQYRWRFAGRTGDKTFDVVQVETNHLLERETTKKIPGYFEPGGTMRFQMVTESNPVCDQPSTFEFAVKLVKLEGNTLQAQTMLSDCGVSSK